MDRNQKKAPPVVRYYGAIGIMIISFFSIIAFVYFGTQAYTNGSSYTPYLAGGATAAVICFISNRIQAGLRDDVEYDEFGQSRKRKFSNLSKQERAKIEEAKMLDSERILPTSELKSMTHTGSKTPEADIDKLIGLPQVKKMMTELSAQMQYDAQFKIKKKNSTEARSYHMCFSGPPGTGKTTVARIMAGLLYKYKIIRTNKCIETDGNTFRGATPADATAKARKILNTAAGGVLFIDEAYALTNGSAGSNNEVVATIIKEMEDNRDGVVIILAGYEDEMRSLIESNPGFKSRIQQYYYFDQYKTEELDQIFIKMAGSEGYTVSDIAIDRFNEIIEPMTKSKHFGNGRTVRNIVQTSIDKHKVNCVKEHNKDKSRISTLTYEDICAPRSI